MALSDLKVDPEKAVMSLDACLVKGYKVKDKLNNDYFPIKDKTERVNGLMPKWRKEASDWANEALKVIQEVFTTVRYAYNFRDAKTDGLMRVGINSDFEGICKTLQARIDVLNAYIQFIFQHANIQIINSNVQVGGSKNKQEIKIEK